MEAKMAELAVVGPRQQSRRKTSRKSLGNIMNCVHDSNIALNNNDNRQFQQPSFGICFDVDGVLARGTIAVPQAASSFQLLKDSDGNIRVPVTFLTNALNKDTDKAAQISKWLGVTISPDQMVQAQGPLEVYHRFHEKFCLVVGQGKIMEIARDLGFKNICTVEEVADSYPLLDMVNHKNRARIAREGYVEKEFPRVEAIILMGEPKRWESALQIIVDLLKTDGKPTHAPEMVNEKHLPVIACNADLQFMDRACMPRFGHGAFLLCLEALYQKVTGKDLKYTSIIGKPSEVTFRYAEHCLARQAAKLGITQPLRRMYIIGDTPEVDIVGSNLYQRYVDRLRGSRGDTADGDISSDENGNKEELDYFDSQLPASRNVPAGTRFERQTVEDVCSVLVCTGVYVPGVSPEQQGEEKCYHGHRDFPKMPDFYKPTTIVNNVRDAVRYVVEREQLAK
ncbi:hypothetical protein NP493_222g02042 [Ridgeia piscesae]|uniref:Haloacid dehalogenase-like hydrolase domain-containing 5 n=1 Tax=Ridgeia piscesae TaxID=27915 RepID=A0AAD9P0E0_RIDPI|nr:hypothetical protein NP493_222g02042 [Ridgeia piscesae]